ncbi:MAG TPA: DUF4446 family protein [Candidatus Paceibacterota bacterium]
MSTLSYILIAALVVLLAWVIRLEFRISRLLAGKNAKTLEDTIVRLRDELTKLFVHKQTTDERISEIDGRVKKSVQWVETVRFNPFRDQGGNQSWSTLLADERGDGVVFTGLWSRDKSSVYAKPIKGRSSDHELSDEERELIARITSN